MLSAVINKTVFLGVHSLHQCSPYDLGIKTGENLRGAYGIVLHLTPIEVACGPPKFLALVLVSWVETWDQAEEGQPLKHTAVANPSFLTIDITETKPRFDFVPPEPEEADTEG